MDFSFQVVWNAFRVGGQRVPSRWVEGFRVAGVPGSSEQSLAACLGASVRKSDFGSENVVPVVERWTQTLNVRMKTDHRLGHRFPGGIGVKTAVDGYCEPE